MASIARQHCCPLQEEGAARIVTRFDPHKDYYKVCCCVHVHVDLLSGRRYVFLALTASSNDKAAGKLDQTLDCSLQTSFAVATPTTPYSHFEVQQCLGSGHKQDCNAAKPRFMLACMQILGVDHAATWREVKAAYKRLALSLHPDKQRRAAPDQASAVAQKFLEVAEANDVLTNEEQRAAYDKIRDYMVGRSCCCDLSIHELLCRLTTLSEWQRQRRCSS